MCGSCICGCSLVGALTDRPWSLPPRAKETQLKACFKRPCHTLHIVCVCFMRVLHQWRFVRSTLKRRARNQIVCWVGSDWIGLDCNQIHIHTHTPHKHIYNTTELASLRFVSGKWCSSMIRSIICNSFGSQKCQRSPQSVYSLFVRSINNSTSIVIQLFGIIIELHILRA